MSLAHGLNTEIHQNIAAQDELLLLWRLREAVKARSQGVNVACFVRTGQVTLSL